MKSKNLTALLSTSTDVKLLLASAFFLGFGFTGFGLILNLYLKQLGYLEGIIGTFLSARTLATMVMTIPAAFMMRRLRLKPVLIISAIFTVAGALLVIFYPQTASVAMGMIIVGLFGSFAAVVSGPMIMKGTPFEHRTFLFSLNFAIGLVSGILGNLLAGVLPDIIMNSHNLLLQGAHLSMNFSAKTIASHAGNPFIPIFTEGFNTVQAMCVNVIRAMASSFTGNQFIPAEIENLASYSNLLTNGYRMSLIVHVAITSTAIIPLLFIKTRKIIDNHQHHFFHVRTKWSRILKLAFPHVLVGLGAGLTVPFLNLYFRDKFLLAPTELGILFSVVQVLMVAGTLVAPHIAARWGKIKTVIIFQMISVPFLFILSLSVDVWLSIAAFLARGALMNMAQPLITNFSLEMTHEDDHPLMSGIMTVAWLASWGISANLGGRLIENMGYFLPFNLTLIAYVLSSLAYLILLLPMEKSVKN